MTAFHADKLMGGNILNSSIGVIQHFCYLIFCMRVKGLGGFIGLVRESLQNLENQMKDLFNLTLMSFRIVQSKQE